ncbi:hypothetical protein L3X38_033495 [Prunus dulcis]|uniref:DUF4371 domain-containing protein n=1 Tax=Prunus dulcis TaxID=3755 RepID=A0AAD4VIF8_PRUDU|nr:hypothetical protein L3X38_033495 [Prunus dulcis]
MSPKIQKDIVNAVVVETTNAIISDIGDSLFSILLDESRDVSVKEQMVVMFRYVDNKGYLIERFMGIEHVASTTALSLKTSIDALFARHHLSISRLHGQGYDGASNMNGEFNAMSSIGASYAGVYVMQKRQKEKLEKKEDETRGKGEQSLHLGGPKRSMQRIFRPRTLPVPRGRP